MTSSAHDSAAAYDVTTVPMETKAATDWTVYYVSSYRPKYM